MEEKILEHFKFQEELESYATKIAQAKEEEEISLDEVLYENEKIWIEYDYNATCGCCRERGQILLSIKDFALEIKKQQ